MNRLMRYLVLPALLGLVLSTYSSITPTFNNAVKTLTRSSLSVAREATAREAYANLPITFEANRGQVAGDIKFLSRLGKGSLALSPTQAALVSDTGSLVTKFVGANPSAPIKGQELLEGKVNYLGGERQLTNIPTYARVVYEGLYSGIDLVYYSNQQRQLEYDFVLAPGANPNLIQLHLEGATSLNIDDNGELVVQTPNGEVRHSKPTLYQEQAGQRQTVMGRFVQHAPYQVGFAVDQYDHSRPLVIDPTLEYSTFLGFSGGGTAIAVDEQGHAYVAAAVTAGFPTTPDVYQPTLNSSETVGSVLVKLNPRGSGFVYATYLESSILNNGLAIDRDGNALVIGGAAGLPVTPDAYQPPPGTDVVTVAKINATGSDYVYVTRFGGTGDIDGGGTRATGIDVDRNGNAYVTGWTQETETTLFPTTVDALKHRPLHPDGNTDAFLTVFNTHGALLYSTFWGGGSIHTVDRVSVPGSLDDGISVPVGQNYDLAYDIVLDASGNVYLTGITDEADFPITTPTDPTQGAGFGFFVTKLSPNPYGTVPRFVVAYSTRPGAAHANAIAVNQAGEAFVTGFVGVIGLTAYGLQTTAGAVQPTSTGSDAFAVKLNAAGSRVLYATYLGGRDGGDTGRDIVVNRDGQATITGSTDAFTFPTTSDAIQRGPVRTDRSVENTFVATLNATGTGLVYGSYLTGSGVVQRPGGLAIDPVGNIYVTGNTLSADFPTTPGAFQRTFCCPRTQFGSDTFITKFRR